MKSLKERRNSGVSEVIGTLLTLSITVTLFTTVFLYMGHFPTPTGTTYANFDVTAEKTNNNTVTWINITHTGGESLKDYDTAIYIMGSSNPSTASTYMFYIHNATNAPADGIWNTGQTLDYRISDNGKIDLSTGYLLVFDRTRNTVVWRGDLTTGLKQPLPPIIMDRGTDPSPISKSSSFRFYVYVNDPNLDFNPGNGNSSLVVSFSSELNISLASGKIVSSVNLTHDIGYRYVSPELNASSNTPIGTHFANIIATDSTNRTSKETLKFVVEKPTAKGRCDIYISQIIFSPGSPVTGETTKITVTFVNGGDAYGYFTPVITDQLPDKSVIRIAPEGLGLVYVSAHGESTRTYIWDSKTPVLYPNNGTRTNQIHAPSPAGNHKINVSAKIALGSPSDSDLSNNNLSAPLSILPKILLVDDDHNKDFNTAAYMEDALNATGYAYDVYTVASQQDDGPQYSTLSKYDVVVWMTGKDTKYSLTTRSGTGDVGNLEKFTNNGGNLWLLGEGIMDNTNLRNFMSSYLGVALPSSQDLNQKLPSVVNGSAALKGIKNVSLRPTGYDNGKYPDYISPSGSSASVSLNDSKKNCIAVSNNVTSPTSPTPYKTMFFSFEFSTIKYSSDRAEIAYQVLRWLSGISGKTGRDVAIGGVTMNPEYPLYGDSVNITINIRNNGWENESVRVQLLIDGVDVTLHPSLVNVARKGGVNTTYGIWNANSLGTHSLVAKVDPYNEIDETDETNNVYVTQFMVRFRTLIVDDDDSSNNGGNQPNNWTWAVVDSFNHLLSSRDPTSTYRSTADIWTVKSGQYNYPNGPTYDNMSVYNAVIWITGDSSFTDKDIENLRQYLNASGMLWIIGDGFLNQFTGTKEEKDFLAQLGINNSTYSLDIGGFSKLTGTLNDPIGHGIDFTTGTSATTGADGLIPLAGAYGVLSGNGDYVGIRYNDGYKTVVFTFNPNATSGLANYYPHPHFPIPKDIANRTTYELSYLVMHWFGQINTNPEMKVGADLYINGEPIDRAHLVLGNSYILEAKIHNVGSEDIIYSNVRFYDGSHIIASSSVGIGAGNISTVSIVWRPAYAGSARPIRVIVDYHEEVKEIPNPDNLSENLFEYNNEIVHYVPVYFFWDDMENGTSNWMHEATVVNINGESPIDFLGAGYSKVYTNVIQNWNKTMSHGGIWTDETYHSYNRSYWLKEPSPTGVPIDQQKQNEPIPIDVVFALDTSGSMGDRTGGWGSPTKWDYAKEAAENFIKNLTENDRAAIWIFDGHGHPKKLIPTDENGLSYMTDQNKQSFIDALENVNPNGGTPFYDMLGDAIENSIVFDPECTNNNRLEFVVAMTDGESNDDEEWSPHANWGQTTNSGGGSSGSGTYKGLLNAPPMVFTIGLLDNKYHDSSYPTAPGWAHYPPPDQNTDSNHIEYDLWNCADSSMLTRGQYGRDYNKSSIGYDAFDSDPNEDYTNPDPNVGHYYYTQDAAQLNNIFRDIRNMTTSISTGNGQATSNGNVTRAGGIAVNALGGGTRSGGGGISIAWTKNQVRYMRSDSITVNGVNRYNLNTSQSSSVQSKKVSSYTSSVGACGIRVYKRDSSGHAVELTPGVTVANVTRSSDGSGIQSATWTPPAGITLNTTDSIVVSVYIGFGSPDTLAANFTTEQLGATTLDHVKWRVYYYTEYVKGGIGFGGMKPNKFYFYWGDSSHDSRIENFQYSCLTPPKIEITSPSGGENWTAGTTHTITWTTTKGSGTITGVNLYYSTDGGSTWNTIVTGTSGTSYNWIPPNSAVSDHAKIRAIVYDSNNLEGSDESPEFKICPGPAAIIKALPAENKVALPSQFVTVIFDSTMDTSKTPNLEQTKGTDPGNWNFEGWFSTFKTDDTAIWTHDNWTAAEDITLKVSDYHAASGNTNSGADYYWSFNVYTFTSSGSVGSTETNCDKTAVTESFDLSNVETAYLTFWHKYNIVPGMNGAFLELGYNKSGDWQWIYMIPGEGAYTGNLNLSATRTDSEGTQIVWGWNGASGKGTFTWEHVKVDLMSVVREHVPVEYRHEIRIKFNYTQYGLGTGYGWYIDDVKVIVSRSDSSPPNAGDSDVWQLTTDDAHSGTHSWWNGDPAGTYFKPGIDNSLISRPIDLTNALNARLSAYFKFNINTSSGAPPDGFRVEVSKDGGVTWTAINLGVRSAWGVSGSNNSGSQTVTGVDSGNNWVEAGSLTRLNVDLSAFRGNTIMLRFRVVTTSAGSYQHYDQATGWGGFYLDDVVISGESLGA